MKCMPRNLIISASATSANVNYPVSNVLSDSQLEPWIAGSQTATLTLTVAGGANGVGLVGVKAMSVNIVVKDSTDTVISDVDIDLLGIEDYLQWMTNTGAQRRECSSTYPYQMAEHTIEISIDSGSATSMPEIGRAGAGGVLAWRHAMDLFVSPKEIGAVEDEFYDGGRYYVPGETVKVFSGSIRHDLVTEFWVWIDRLGADLKRAPCFWWIVDQNNVKWFTFARFASLPGSQIYHSFTKTKFELIEDKG